MKRLFVLEIYDYDMTLKYGFSNLVDLCDFIKKRDYKSIEVEYYIYCTWLNEDKINSLGICLL